MHLNATYKNSWNRKQNKVCVILDSELYRRKPVLTYATSGNVVGGFGEFGEYAVEHRTVLRVFLSIIIMSDFVCGEEGAEGENGEN